jgi:hypothetical protein
LFFAVPTKILNIKLTNPSHVVIKSKKLKKLLINFLLAYRETQQRALDQAEMDSLGTSLGKSDSY